MGVSSISIASSGSPRRIRSGRWKWPARPSAKKTRSPSARSRAKISGSESRAEKRGPEARRERQLAGPRGCRGEVGRCRRRRAAPPAGRPHAGAAPGPRSPPSGSPPTAPPAALESPRNAPPAPRPEDPARLSDLSAFHLASPLQDVNRSQIDPPATSVSPTPPDPAADHTHLHREGVWSAAGRGLKPRSTGKWLELGCLNPCRGSCLAPKGPQHSHMDWRGRGGRPTAVQLPRTSPVRPGSRSSRRASRATTRRRAALTDLPAMRNCRSPARPRCPPAPAAWCLVVDAFIAAPKCRRPTDKRPGRQESQPAAEGGTPRSDVRNLTSAKISTTRLRRSAVKPPFDEP